MKIVINDCFGGFSLSPLAIKMWAKRKGRQCYFFRNGRDAKGGLSLDILEPLTLGEAEKEGIFIHAYDIPNPQEVLTKSADWHDMTDAEKSAHNALYEKHSLYGRDIPRDDPDLLAVVEALGDAASGKVAKLAIVEIPDGVEWEIDEYDGLESIHEKHRSWSA